VPHFAWHWVQWTWGGDGTGGAAGTGYLITSGPLGFAGKIAIIWVLLHHLNCHEHGCWRIARHRADGYCRKHHRSKI
jgi:hypothetical protein